MRFNQLPLRLQALIIVQALAAAATAYASWKPLDPANAGMLAFLVLCGILGGACKVDVNVTFGRLSLGFTVTYFALLLLGTEAALLVGFLSTLAGVVCNLKEPGRRLLPLKAISTFAIYNYGNGALATAAMAWVYHALGGATGRFEPSAMALPILASAFTYYALNTGGITLAIAWSQNKAPVAVFREHWAWAWPGFLAGACLSAGLLWAYRYLAGGPAVLLLVPPAYLVYYFYRMRTDKVRGDIAHMREVNRLNDAVIGSLAMAIEAKDRYTSKHVNRVREYATRLGEKLGVSESELEAVRIASLLHDIGKIGIPEAILCKPGKLTSEEFEVIKSHVEIGAAILDRIDFPWPVASVVRTHHERWDGLGYPQGLKGDAIPIGGRIISLVDVYDALTSDRPYRQAVTREQAIQILRAGSGSQFDPRVVETFVSILPDLDAAIARIQEEVDAEEEALARLIPELPQPAAACEEREDAAILQELHDLAQEESGIVVMAPALAEKISKLVPYTTCALFLKNSERRTLMPIHAAGLWTELLDGIEIRIGEGVTGYVAASREPQLNAAAALDLARRLRPSENLELNSTLCVPLLLGDEVVGALTLYHSSYNFYQPYHCERLERIAMYAVEAVASSRRDQLELPLPSEDLVTQLPNQYALHQFLAGQVNISQTLEAEFTVVKIAVEATTSAVPHAVGAIERDRMLLEVARMLREMVRDGDMVARCSDNAFALVLPGCGRAEGRQTAFRVLEQAACEGMIDPEHRVALQAGVAVYPTDGTTPDALLQTATHRLGHAPAPAGIGAGVPGARPPARIR